MAKISSPSEKLQSLVHACLTCDAGCTRAAIGIRLALAILIALNVLAFALQTDPSLNERFKPWFDALLHVSMIVFSIEFVLRIWAAPAHSKGLYAKPLRGRLRYLFTPLMLIDLIVLLPYFLGPAGALDLRFLRLIRLLWLTRIGRHLPAVAMLGQVLKRERRTLTAVMFLMLVILFLASSLVYLLEHQRQPEHFASIPHAMWWGITTLTTVGYGDVVPISPLGRVLGVVIMLLGIGTFALPAGILASAFTEERKRRNFMLTWNLVARVPLFSSLTASEIADIASLLHPRDVMAKEVVLKRDEEADSMYFIVSGKLEAELQPEPVVLSAGEYFGEVGLLFHVPRTATVIALTRAELLELEAKDLHLLFERKPALRQPILREAEKRLALDQATDTA